MKLTLHRTILCCIQFWYAVSYFNWLVVQHKCSLTWVYWWGMTFKTRYYKLQEMMFVAGRAIIPEPSKPPPCWLHKVHIHPATWYLTPPSSTIASSTKTTEVAAGWETQEHYRSNGAPSCWPQGDYLALEQLVGIHHLEQNRKLILYALFCAKFSSPMVAKKSNKWARVRVWPHTVVTAAPGIANIGGCLGQEHWDIMAAPWNWKVVMLTNLRSLAAPKVVIMTTSSIASDYVLVNTTAF